VDTWQFLHLLCPWLCVGWCPGQQSKLTQDVSPATMSRCPKVRSELILFKCWVHVLRKTFLNVQPILLLVGKKGKLSALGHVWDVAAEAAHPAYETR